MLISILTTLLFLLIPSLAVSQPEMPRVGILVPEMGRSQSQTLKGLREELKRLGHQERKTILLDIQDTKGNRAALEPAAMELVGRNVDAIVVTGTRAAWVAKSATGNKIPIVFVHPADPVILGLVKNMEASGGNITGVAGLAAQATEARLSILREILPNLQRVHVFYDSNDKFSRENFATVEKAASRLRLKVVDHGIKSLAELKATMGVLENRDGDALFHVPDDTVESGADFIFDTARQKKLPTMYHEEAWAIKGALAAYGPSYYEMGRQAARLLQAIVKEGRKAEALPVERVSKFELILNYRTARFIGVNFSRDILKKADRVIR